MKKLFKNILNWISNPDETTLKLSFREKLILLLKILLLDMLIIIPLVGLIYQIHFYVVKLKQPLIDIQPLFLFLGMVLIAPIIEEFIFRFPLKYKRNYIAQLLNWITQKRFEKKGGSIYKYFVYLMIMAFGIIHLTNFENRELLFYVLAPIIVGSQLIGGVTLSYTRVKLGFIWSVALHSAFNLFMLLSSLIFYHNKNHLNISNDDLMLKLTELIYIDTDDAFFDFNAENDIIYTIDGNDIDLFRLINFLQEDGPKPYDNAWIDVNLESKKGVTKKELLEILKNNIKFDE